MTLADAVIANCLLGNVSNALLKSSIQLYFIYLVCTKVMYFLTCNLLLHIYFSLVLHLFYSLLLLLHYASGFITIIEFFILSIDGFSVGIIGFKHYHMVITAINIGVFIYSCIKSSIHFYPLFLIILNYLILYSLLMLHQILYPFSIMEELILIIHS